LAGTTVVSARSRPVRSSFASAARASSASFRPSTAALPHRVVSFISVAGCGTLPSSGIRQNRRQVIESLTSAHTLSKPSLRCPELSGQVHPLGWAIWKGEDLVAAKEELLTGIQG
jgi:hypothetical protein